jgi:cellulose synthase/poly-beta-1,6-N-acetylglucosamine synthase-like glycosyltransferase
MSVHNEEKVIQDRLKNIVDASYPKEKMEIIIIDDASTDTTLTKINDFVVNNPQLSIKVIEQNQRMGKAKALNKGFKVASNEFIVETDADVFWPPDILSKAVPYMADPTIGAVSGRGALWNPSESWVTKGEESYMNFMSVWRLGQSKIHSTLRFEGCFSIFRKGAFNKFDESGADDSGTALQITQNNFRTILAPEACVYGEIPKQLKGRTKIKMRRATHLAGMWLHCLNLLIKKRLVLPKRIAVPEILLSVFIPFVFVALVSLTPALLVFYPVFLVPLVLLLCIVTLSLKVRSYIVQRILDQFILFCAVILNVKKKKYVTWEK